MRPSRVLAVLSTITLCALGAPAHAQDVASAQKMFDQGLADMEAGRFDKGCPALAASFKLDPRPGTVFTLAECEAQWGRLATAVARYDDYLSMYDRLTDVQQRKQGERPKLAREQKAVLTPQVPELTLSLPPDAPSGTRVKRDGTEIAPAMLGVALPVDPGEHVLTTQAPGGEVTELRVTIGKGEKKQVILQVKAPGPVVASKPGGAAFPDAAPEPRSRIPAVVMGGAALIAMGAGAGLFVVSEGKRTDTFNLAGTIGKRNGNCVSAPIDKSCDEVKSLARQSDTLHNVAIGAFIGAGALAVGTLIYLLLPPPKVKNTVIQSAGIQVSPVLSSERGGVVMSGVF